ncbi:DUF6644 family protein [Salipiger thiooxidans]|uniref:DUF6644 family protein n=1 Tax=Salipiger thiooxidans TaxID=282683 RepID=UPI001CFB78D9|nr:DUF6644 family protein [Salipiger thiooxidans]
MLDWLSASLVAQALTASATLYIFVSAAHILSIGLLMGAVILLDLRLLGLWRNMPLQELAPFLSAAALSGVVLAIVTGGVLFTVRAEEYVVNPAFLAKMGLLALGIVNAVLLQTGAPWRRALEAGRTSGAVKLSAAFSLTIWIAALVAGRWIGFI